LLSQTQFLFMFLFSLGLLSLETRWTKANTRQNLYCLYCVFLIYINKGGEYKTVSWNWESLDFS